MTDENISYIRCRNCGKHIEENHSIGKLYCSENCAGIFTRCPNCGKFFPELNKDRHKGFCSLDCEAVYSEDGIIISTEDQTESNSLSDDSQDESSNDIGVSQILEENHR